MKTTIVLAATLLLLGALTQNVGAQTAEKFPAAANGQITFVMPSKNIGCTFTPAGGTAVYKPFDGGPELSCDNIKPKYVRAVLTPKKIRTFNNVGDQDCCGVENVLKHGARWSQGPFTCDSAESGLTCKRADGRGFTIGPKGIKQL
jgi:hypothetical protein